MSVELPGSDRLVLRRYLLGQLSPAEQDRVEEQFADLDYFAIYQNIERGLVQEYAAGTMAPEEAELFARNYLVTSKRRDQVAIAQALSEAYYSQPAIQPVRSVRLKKWIPVLAMAASVMAAAVVVRSLRPPRPVLTASVRPIKPRSTAIPEPLPPPSDATPPAPSKAPTSPDTPAPTREVAPSPVPALIESSPPISVAEPSPSQPAVSSSRVPTASGRTMPYPPAVRSRPAPMAGLLEAAQRAPLPAAPRGAPSGLVFPAPPGPAAQPGGAAPPLAVTLPTSPISALPQGVGRVIDHVLAQYPVTVMDASGIKVATPGAILVVQMDGVMVAQKGGGSSLYYNEFKSGIIGPDTNPVHVVLNHRVNPRALALGEKVYLLKVDTSATSITFRFQSCGTCDPLTLDPSHRPSQGEVTFKFVKGGLQNTDFNQVKKVIDQLFKLNDEVSAPIAAPPSTGYSAPPPRSPADFPPPPPPLPADAVKLTMGMTIDQVKAVLGNPVTILETVSTVIYLYKDLKVTFKNGRLSDFE